MIYSYIRVSTDKQSLSDQKSLISEYCHQNNIKVDEFIEIEISSRKSIEQRQLGKLDVLKKGDTLICIELSRLGRNLLEILTMVKDLKSRQVNVIFIRQPELNTSSNNALNDLILSIYGYIAQTERELISQRTKEALSVKKQQGIILGRKKGYFTGSELDSRIDIIREDLKSGLSVNKIALKIGTSRQNLTKYIERHNI